MTKRLLTALFAMSLVFAACSSDDDDDSADSTTTEAAAASDTTTANDMDSATTTHDMMDATSTSAGDDMGSETTMAGSETTMAAEGEGITFVSPDGLDDEQQGAVDVWDEFLTSGATSGAQVKDLVQDGDEIEGVLDAFINNDLSKNVAVTVKGVVVDGDSAALDMIFAVPGLPEAPTSGESVKVDGEWKVGKSTICALGSMIQTPCPS
ncbi:MAG: hypothetical protein KDB86_12125 [Actinobacteria bacterium]|nr:hypothetical protein [Actinomycetota bacterium]MCB9389591.1 hypothetical protein [Acidimicrobiia bacterium]